MSITTIVAIPASHHQVRAVLSDLKSYPDWNPFVRKAEGAHQTGARWQTELTLDGRLFFPVPMRITHWVPGQRLTWEGGIPGVMMGSHSFEIFDAGEAVTFEQSEQFSGPVVSLVLPFL